MKDNNCAYCMGGELLDKFGIKICDLDVSQLSSLKSRANREDVLLLTRIM